MPTTPVQQEARKGQKRVGRQNFKAGEKIFAVKVGQEKASTQTNGVLANPLEVFSAEQVSLQKNVAAIISALQARKAFSVFVMKMGLMATLRPFSRPLKGVA